MKKKKLLGTLIATALVLSMSVMSVFADGEVTTTPATVDTSKTGSITIVKIKENDGKYEKAYGVEDDELTNVGMQGIEFKALKIADMVNVSGDDTVGMYFQNLDEDFINLITKNNVLYRSHTINGKTYYTTEDIENMLLDLGDITTAKSLDGTTEAPGEVQVINMVREKTTAVTFDKTDANGIAYKNELPLGLYLIAETDYSDYVAQAAKDLDVNTNAQSDVTNSNTTEIIYDPSCPYLVSLPMTNQTTITDSQGTEWKEGTVWQYDVYTYPKNQTGAIPKYVVKEGTDELELTDDYEIGETAHQLIAASAPAIIEDHVYEKYVVNDTMEKGLNFKELVEVKLGKKIPNPTLESDFSGFEVLTKDTDYKLEVAEDEKSFDIVMLDAGLAKLNAMDYNGQVVVIFDAIVTSDASDGVAVANTNKPRVTIKNSNTEEFYHEGNLVGIFTYRLDVTKKGVDDGNNVQFKVVRNNEEVKFIKEEDGLYHLFDNVNDLGKEEEAVTIISPSKEEKKLILRGLDSDTYTFTEIATEFGHELLKSEFNFTITATEPHVDGNIAKAQVETDGEASDVTTDKGTAFFTVENPPSITLHTGGAGRKALFCSAGLVALAGIGFALYSKKKNKEVLGE